MEKANKIKATIAIGGILAGTVAHYIYGRILFTIIIAFVIAFFLFLGWKHIEDKNKVIVEENKNVGKQ